VKPWAEVFINGKKIGETPFKPIKLNPGTYRVRLKNPQINKSVEKTVHIKAGKDVLLKNW
jgi:serine/threonine-protein kinase